MIISIPPHQSSKDPHIGPLAIVCRHKAAIRVVFNDEFAWGFATDETKLCVCVCVCVYTHTHTQTTKLRKTPTLSPSSDPPGAAFASQQQSSNCNQPLALLELNFSLSLQLQGTHTVEPHYFMDVSGQSTFKFKSAAKIA